MEQLKLNDLLSITYTCVQKLGIVTGEVGDYGYNYELSTDENSY